MDLISHGCQKANPLLWYNNRVDSSDTFNARRIARNTLILSMRTFIVTIAKLVSVRLVLRALGIEGYGLLAAVSAVATVTMLLNGVLRSTAQRFLSCAQGKSVKDQRGAFSAVIAVSAVLCGLILVAGETGGSWFVCHLLVIPYELAGVARIVFQVEIASVIVKTLQIPFLAQVNASERMGVFAKFSIVEAVLAVGRACLVTWAGRYRIELYACLELASEIVVLLFYVCYCRQRFPCTAPSCRFHVINLQNQLSYFSWSALHAVANVLKHQGIGLIVNVYAGVASNAAWKLGWTIGCYLFELPTNFQQAYFPQVVKLWQEGDCATFRRIVSRLCWLSFALTGMCAIPLAVFAEPVLVLWTGGTLPPMSVPFLRCFLAHYLIDAFINPLHSAVLATGRIAAYEIGQFLTIGLGFFLALGLLSAGCPGWMSVGAMAFSTAVNLVYHVFYTQKALGFTWCDILNPFAMLAWVRRSPT